MLYHNQYGENDGNDLNGYKSEVKATVRALRNHLDQFDAIVVRGMSGVLMGGPVSLILDKPLAIVRKPGEKCHAYDKEGINLDMLSNRRVLFLDDFVSMGDTRKACDDVVTMMGGYMTTQFEYASHDRCFCTLKHENTDYGLVIQGRDYIPYDEEGVATTDEA